MADQRQPDYDFFGPGQAPRQPAPQPRQPYGVPPHQPHHAAQPTQQPYGVPPQRFGAPGGLPPAPYLVPRRSRAVTALIVAAIVVASLVAAGIVAAVALPVYLGHRMRAEWEATSIGLPETFDGGARTAVPAAARSQLATEDELMTSDLALYRTTGGTTVVVVAGKTKRPMSDATGASFRRGMLAGMAQSGLSVSLTESDPGRLGGWFGCGAPAGMPTGAPTSVCVAVDHASVVLVVVAGSADGVSVARRMREAAVRR